MKSFLHFIWCTFDQTVTFRCWKLNALHPTDHKNLHSVLLHQPIHPTGIHLKSNVKMQKKIKLKEKHCKSLLYLQKLIFLF